MRNILITGAASGIGLALAHQYWQRGDHVHLIDRDAEALAACRKSFEQGATFYEVDLLDQGELETFCQRVLTSQMPVHRLINNAGIAHRSPASKTRIEVFQRVMALNWQVPVTLSQKLLPCLSQAGGKIINLASMAALMPVPGRAAYCGSKAALTQHFETWRPELALADVELLMVFPSFVATNIEGNALGLDGLPAKHAQSTIGGQISAAHMASLIVKADKSGKQRYLSTSAAPRLGYWLWTLFPRVFQRISWRKFAQELS